MSLSVIKPQYANKYVGFGKGSGRLGKRQDIDDLAIIALESKDESLLTLFETLPPLADLKKNKVETLLKRTVTDAGKEG